MQKTTENPNARTMKRRKKPRRISRNIYSVISIIVFLGVVLCFTYTKIIPSTPFWPINGTYQNYNVVRRLLAGQRPYRDFTVYLGLGHLYIGSIFTFLFGNNYTASILAFTFLTLITFSLSSVALGYARNKNIEVCLYSTSIILILMVIRPLMQANVLGIEQSFVDSWLIATDMGGSARTLRSLILPMAIFAYYALIEAKGLNEMVRSALVGVLIGISISFSNDYGIATAMVLAMVRGLRIITDRKNRIGYKVLQIVLTIMGMAAGLFAIIRLLTGVSFFEWVEKQRGISSYQSWYYNQNKSYYVYQIRTDLITNIQGLIALCGLIRIIRNKSTKKNEIITIMNFAGWLVVQEAELLGGGSIEVERNILWLTIVWWLIDFVEMQVSNRGRSRLKPFRTVALVLCAAFAVQICMTSFTKIISSENSKTDVTDKLGGNLATFEEDIEKAADFVGDKKVFSTYASALEDVCDSFQPSGYDYIIHVLGDRAREEYLDSFNNSGADYVTVQRTANTPWEYWIRNANWFFYRELYRWYKPVNHNKYEVFYERGDEDQLIKLPESTRITTRRKKDGSVIVRVYTDEDIFGIADLEIDYKIVKNDRLRSKLVFRTDLLVTETSEIDYYNGPASEDSMHTFSLPPEGKTFIPVTIVDGKGRVQLDPKPTEATELELYSVSCNGYYSAPNSYFCYKGMQGRGIAIEKDSDSSYLINRSQLKWIDLGEEKYRIQYFAEGKNAILVYPQGDISKAPSKRKNKYIRIY